VKKPILGLTALVVLPLLFMGFACGGGGGGGEGSTAEVLFVDDDNGLNNRGNITNYPDVDHVYIADLDALGIDHDMYRVMGEMSDGPDLLTLQKYEVVIWATGEPGNGNSATPLTLTLPDQANLAEYLEGGGTLFLSGQEILFDLNNGVDGDVLSAFANTYLGVLDADDGGPTLTATWGVTGDPVSDGLVISGPDMDDDEYFDAFSSVSRLGPENGSAIWDSSGIPQTLTMTASSSTDFASTVFSGTYDIGTLTDDTLSFGGHSFWAFTDGSASLLDEWFEPLGVNHYATLDLKRTPGSYTYNEYDGMEFEEYADSLNNTHSFPAHADTLLEDPDGLAVATRVEQSPWKVIFLALPYEGFLPDGTRRGFLEDSINWLQQ